MSQTETHVGKFKILAKGKDNILEYIKEHNIESESEYYNILDGDVLIEYIEHKKYDEDTYLMEFTKNEDGTIDFVIQFYNGGCCLSEALSLYKKYVEE